MTTIVTVTNQASLWVAAGDAQMTVRDMIAGVRTMNRAEAAAILGVGLHASPAEIKSAYRAAVKCTHPDLVEQPDRQDRLEVFYAVRAAFQVLTSSADRPTPPHTDAGRGSPSTPRPQAWRRPMTAAQARFVTLTVADDLGRCVDRRC